MKVKTRLVGVVTVISLAVAFMFGCMPAAEKNPTNERGQALSSATEVLAFSAAGAGQMLSMSSGNDLLFSAPKIDEKSEMTNAEIERVNQYLSLLEGMLANENPFETVVTENSEYESVTYQYKMDIKLSLIGDAKLSYTLYINETSIVNETSQNESKDDEDKNGTGIESKTESSLDGVMLYGDAVYKVSGKKEFESESEGTETETEFCMQFEAFDEVTNKRVTARQVSEKESEDGETEQEQKFDFAMYDGETLQYGSRIKMSEEQKGTEKETMVKLELIVNGTTSRYELKKETENGEEKIRLKIFDRSGNGVDCIIKIITDSQNGESSYEYTFSSGHKKQMNRG